MPRESTNEDNLKLLDSLIDNWENETIEFKEASNDFDTDRIGRYVSALSNEANLADLESGWLVFGVKNKTRAVVGTGYGTDPRRIDSLKRQINDDTDPSTTFRSAGQFLIRTDGSSCSKFPPPQREYRLHGKDTGTAALERTRSPLLSTRSTQSAPKVI